MPVDALTEGAVYDCFTDGIIGMGSTACRSVREGTQKAPLGSRTATFDAPEAVTHVRRFKARLN